MGAGESKPVFERLNVRKNKLKTRINKVANDIDEIHAILVRRGGYTGKSCDKLKTVRRLDRDVAIVFGYQGNEQLSYKSINNLMKQKLCNIITASYREKANQMQNISMLFQDLQTSLIEILNSDIKVSDSKTFKILVSMAEQIENDAKEINKIAELYKKDSNFEGRIIETKIEGKASFIPVNSLLVLLTNRITSQIARFVASLTAEDASAKFTEIREMKQELRQSKANKKMKTISKTELDLLEIEASKAKAKARQAEKDVKVSEKRQDMIEEDNLKQQTLRKKQLDELTKGLETSDLFNFGKVYYYKNGKKTAVFYDKKSKKHYIIKDGKRRVLNLENKFGASVGNTKFSRSFRYGASVGNTKFSRSFRFGASAGDKQFSRSIPARRVVFTRNSKFGASVGNPRFKRNFPVREFVLVKRKPAVKSK